MKHPLEYQIRNFVGNQLKGITYVDSAAEKIINAMVDLYIEFYNFYYISVTISLLCFFIYLFIRINIDGKKNFNIPSQIIKTFFIVVLFYSFPFLFNFIISICNLIADKLCSVDKTMVLFKELFGIESRFHEYLNTETTDQTALEKVWSGAKKVTSIIGQMDLFFIIKSCIYFLISLFVLCCYICFIVIRFASLSILFILAPIILPITLFGKFGSDLFNRYFKSILSISSWIIIKAALDAVSLEFFLATENGTWFSDMTFDDVFYVGLLVAYATLILTIPFISSYLIGGINLSPTLVGTSLITYANAKKLLTKGKEFASNKVNDGVSSSGKFSLGGKK